MTNKRPRCAPYTASLCVDPIGTAPECHDLVGIETPRPWPRDIMSHPEFEGLGDLIASMADSGRKVKVVALLPEERTSTDRGLRVVRWHRPVGVAAARFDATVIERSSARLVTDVQGILKAAGEGHEGIDLLVCAHGSRDACCGSQGTRLAQHLRDHTRADRRVWQTSHLGGHRFAATAISMPEGRAWAYLDAATVRDLVERRSEPNELSMHDRGSMLLPPEAQVLERVLLHRMGWEFLSTRRVGEVALGVAGETAASVTWSRVRGTALTATATVRIKRTIPMLQCGVGPDPQAVAHEYVAGPHLVAKRQTSGGSG